MSQVYNVAQLRGKYVECFEIVKIKKKNNNFIYYTFTIAQRFYTMGDNNHVRIYIIYATYIYSVYLYNLKNALKFLLGNTILLHLLLILLFIYNLIQAWANCGPGADCGPFGF